MSPKVKNQSIVPSKESFQEFIKTRIVGADETLLKIFNYIQGHSLGLRYPEDPPIGAFLLLGPTGVGKTKTVEVIAEWLHGTPRAVLKINCAEYVRDHEVAKLIGSPPGYMGHRETVPRLTQQKLANVVSERSDISVVLFDEIEKADKAIYQLLLGILDKGELSLGDNSTVRFKNSLIFFTSNLGAQKIAQKTGFIGGQQEISYKAEIARINSAVDSFFTPEWLNRISERFYYQHLTKEQIENIVDLELTELRSLLKSRHYAELEVTDVAKKALVDIGFSREFGARELQRTIKREVIQNALTSLMEYDNIKYNVVVVHFHKGKFTAALRSATYED